LLASVVIPAGTSAPLRNRYRYVGIPPLMLSAGQTYRIGAVMHCDDFTPEFNSLASVSIDPGLTAIQTRRIAFGTSLACPTQTISQFSFAPNFLIGPACGNDVVQAGEECDDGNTADGDCCSSTCQYEAKGSPCPADDEVCTDDVCDATGTCTHPAGNAGAICRPDAGECDVAEQCDGSSPTCPADGFEPNGMACTDDGLYCSGDETCQSGTCTSSGDPCAVGTCDESSDQCLPPSPTATVTLAPTGTATQTATGTATRTATLTPTPSATPTPTKSPTATVTPAPTGTATQTATGTRTAIATSTGSVTPTRTSSPTATPTPAGTATATPSTQATPTPPPTATDTPATVACVGDCDGSAAVAISELITGVTIALGNQPIDRCPEFDSSGNGAVEINELIAAVNNALNGCP
jgi:cysteine-rich repeat protein